MQHMTRSSVALRHILCFRVKASAYLVCSRKKRKTSKRSEHLESSCNKFFNFHCLFNPLSFEEMYSFKDYYQFNL